MIVKQAQCSLLPFAMFSGAQISLYPMTGDFVGVIMSALSALDLYRDRLRIETDDISTLLVDPRSAVSDHARSLCCCSKHRRALRALGRHFTRLPRSARRRNLRLAAAWWAARAAGPAQGRRA